MHRVLDRLSDFNYLYARLPQQILMDDDPKKLRMFNSLCGTIINTDGEITKIDLLSRRMKYNKFSFIKM